MEGTLKFALLTGAVSGALLNLPGGIWILVLLLAVWHLSAAVVALVKSRLPLLALAALIEAAAVFLVIPVSRLGFSAEALPFAITLAASWLSSSTLRRVEKRRSAALRQALAEREDCSFGELLRHSWLPVR